MAALSASPTAPTEQKPSRVATALAAVVIVAATVAAYFNSCAGAFVYDDHFAILENTSLHRLADAFTPPANGSPVSGRPLVNFSFALNYAFGGTAPTGYHLANLAIHVFAALALFGFVRRTLLLPRLRPRFAADATPLAALVATLWAVHPLQTEAVTYVAQRAESLMGLFFLLTCYGFVRAVEPGADKRWPVLCVAACALGMACKEVMAVAPVIVLVYDRVFLAGEFRVALRQRARLYKGLALTWLVLAALVIRSGSRAGTAGFGTTATPWAYASVQGHALMHYLALALWPRPLVFDYGTEPTAGTGGLVLGALAVFVLALATALAVRRRVAAGFLGAWFFLILAPSSSFVPVATEVVAEHRMYLPLAAVVAGLVLAAHAWKGRIVLLGGAAAVGGLAFLTAQRNADYRSELALWRETVAHCPGNARAHFNLGALLAAGGQTDDAIREYQSAIQIRPDFASAHSNLGDALLERGRFADAQRAAEAALRLNPRHAEAQVTLANALYRLDRVPEALAHYQEAVRLAPGNADLRTNLGSALSRLDRLDEAAVQYEFSLHLRPAHAETHFFLGNTCVRLGRLPEAVAQYEEALRLRPDYAAARDNLARVRAFSSPARPKP